MFIYGDGGNGYQAAPVFAFLPAPCLDCGSESCLVNLCSGLEHATCCLSQHLGLTVEAGEVEAHQEGAGLYIGDLVRQEVRDGLGNLFWCYGIWVSEGPETGKQRLDVDRGELARRRGMLSRQRHARSWKTSRKVVFGGN